MASASTDRRRVRLRYLGHCAFLWTSQEGARVVADPWRNPEGRPRWFEAPFPRVVADLAASTHDHFDHDAVDLVQGDPALLTGPGRWRGPGTTVTGVPDEHAGRWAMPNTLIVVEAGGVRFCHCGDNRPAPSQEAVRAAGEIDVVMAPVDDSRHLLGFPEVWQLAAAFSPRVIIPMHYFIDGITAGSSTLRGIDEWLASLPDSVPVRQARGPEMMIGPGDLPDRGRPEVWVFRPADARAPSGGGSVRRRRRLLVPAHARQEVQDALDLGPGLV